MYLLLFLTVISLTALAIMFFYLRLAFPGKLKPEVKTEDEVLKELSEEYKERTKQGKK